MRPCSRNLQVIKSKPPSAYCDFRTFQTETPQYVREQANSLSSLLASSQDAGFIESQRRLLEHREQVWNHSSKKEAEEVEDDKQVELVLVGGGDWESRVYDGKIFYVNKSTKETTW